MKDCHDCPWIFFYILFFALFIFLHINLVFKHLLNVEKVVSKLIITFHQVQKNKLKKKNLK